MADTTTNISIRTDSKLKAQADALFAELGMSMSTDVKRYSDVEEALRALKA